jgi:hypothetical protein
MNHVSTRETVVYDYDILSIVIIILTWHDMTAYVFFVLNCE